MITLCLGAKHFENTHPPTPLKNTLCSGTVNFHSGGPPSVEGEANAQAPQGWSREVATRQLTFHTGELSAQSFGSPPALALELLQNWNLS